MPGDLPAVWSANHRRFLSLCCILIFAAPAAFGCYQPWASGFLVAAICVLTAVHIVFCIRSSRPVLAVPKFLKFSAGLLCGWLAILALIAWMHGDPLQRSPFYSFRALS